MSKEIHLNKPAIKRKDLEHVLESLIQDKLEYGDFANNFESKLVERIGVQKALAVNSFYSALELIFEAIGIEEGDEVILPSFAPRVYLDVLLKRKATPVLVDLDDRFFKPSVKSIENAISDKTKAMLLKYYFGYTFDPQEYNGFVPFVIEDISSVIGASVNESKLGTFGTFAVADFSPSELITTGDGAAVFSSNKKNFSILKKLTDKNILSNEYSVYMPYLMPDLNAAMGVSQNSTLNHRLKLRDTIGKIYEESVSKSRNAFIKQIEDFPRIYSDFPILIKNSLKDAIAFFKKNKIETGKPYDFPLHHYLNLPKEDFKNTEDFYLKTLMIPLHSTLLKKDVDHISKVLIAMI